MWSNEAVNTMKLSRRQFLRFAASAPALSAASRPKANIRGHIWYLRQVRRAYRPKTPEGAANSTYVHFLFGLIFKYEATTEQGRRSQGPNDTARPRRRGDRMKRRGFITPLRGPASWPRAARAQQAASMGRVAVLLPVTADDPDFQARVGAFLQGLQEAGWSIGRNLRIDTRWAGANANDIRRHVAELVALAPDVILA